MQIPYQKSLFFYIYIEKKNSQSTREARCVPNPGRRQPQVPINELRHREVHRLRPTGKHMVPGPLNPGRHSSARPVIHVLSIIQSIQGEIPIPLEPPFGPDSTTNIRLQNHRPRIRFPGPAQIRLRRIKHVGLGGYVAELDRKSRVFNGLLSALSRDGVLLVW